MKKPCRWCGVEFDYWVDETECYSHRDVWNPEEGTTLGDDVDVLTKRLEAVLARLEQVEKGHP